MAKVSAKFHRALNYCIVMPLVMYMVVLGMMYFFQTTLLYHPVHEIESPAAYGLPHVQAATLHQPMGIDIQIWYAPPRKSKPTIVYFHGNGGNLSGRQNYFKAFTADGYGLVAVDYRGFGASMGLPSELGILEDARAAVHFAQNHLHQENNQIILFGESLGTGVAVHMAEELSAQDQPPALLVLQSPYTSVANRAAELYPYIPVRWLLKDPFESLARISNVKAPVLILHGEDDPIIPLAHGQAMFEAAHEPKRGVFLPGVHHTDFDVQEILGEMESMLPLPALPRE